jgi:hypothetical protein
MADKVALGQVSLRVIRFYSVNVIPPLLHTHLSLLHKLYDSPDQAAHHHTIAHQGFTSDLALGWKKRK